MVTLNDLLWTSIYNADNAEYPAGLSKDQLEKAKQKKALEEYKRLKQKFGFT